jgi:hypothetical protein
MLMQADLQTNTAVLPVIREPMTWHPVIVAGALRKVVHELFDTYHPERHYMRGPGPRWREKHALDSAFDKQRG